MIKHILTAALLLSVFAAKGSNPARVDKSYEVAIYYCPMYTQTYYAIQSLEIEKMFDLTSLTQRDADKIIAILDQGTPATDFHNDIRLKVVGHGRTILLDLYGRIREGDKVTKITRKQYREIYNIIWADLPKS